MFKFISPFTLKFLHSPQIKSLVLSMVVKEGLDLDGRPAARVCLGYRPPRRDRSCTYAVPRMWAVWGVGILEGDILIRSTSWSFDASLSPDTPVLCFQMQNKVFIAEKNPSNILVFTARAVNLLWVNHYSFEIPFTTLKSKRRNGNG